MMDKEKNKGEARAAMEDIVRNASRNMSDPALTPVKQEKRRAGDLMPCPLSSFGDLVIDWLWEPYIQRGNISILRADPGTGKTFFVAALMAAVAGNEQPPGMPGTLSRSNGRCVYFGTEDDPETIKYRIKSAGGGNLDNIWIVRDPVTFAETDKIKNVIERCGADLIIFDTMQNYLGSKVNMNSANETAPVLNALREMARETSCAVLITEHKNKNEKGSALYRGIGSMSIIGAARSLLEIVRDPDARNIRYTMQIKTNYREAPGIVWTITDSGEFVWRGETEKTQDDINEAVELASVPIIMAAREIVEKHPDGWRGSAGDLQKECGDIPGFNAQTIGKALADPRTLYQLRTLFDIYIMKTKNGGKSVYTIGKREQNKHTNNI